jgi:antitoxin YefM
MQETPDILGDDEALSDLQQSREDFTSGDTFDAERLRAELARRCRDDR